MDLAEKSGVSQPTICQIENEKRKFATHKNIKKIARALEVDIAELDEEEQAAEQI